MPMSGFDVSELQAGQSVSKETGERIGRSAGGRLVQLRRRVSERGFVVTVDALAEAGAQRELITQDWRTANATFDRFMREY
ncbi:hypothetical protein GU90_13555 [Saccharopolyspora rectivirgula]|uniref:Uncharacterized protein n=2 Tax=Saccharopolyspora rectivirgula TaxID=28042 RepID=A0A073B8D4_9PSEU|nr:hypothetical protein GU90_13555 [Saccharopolyspora rectivirgula]